MGRHPLNVLQDDIAVAIMEGPQETLHGKDPLPIVETDRQCIEHYNKANLAGFDKMGYFIMRDVIICEKGKKEELRQRLHQNLDGFVQVAGGAGGKKH